MLGGPKFGLTASIAVPEAATAWAAAPIFCVIDAVVLGFTTRMCMGVRPDSQFSAKIERLDAFIVEKLGRAPGERDGTGRERIGARGDLERDARILLDQEHAYLLVAINGNDRAGDVLHQLRGDAKRGLV